MDPIEDINIAEPAGLPMSLVPQQQSILPHTVTQRTITQSYGSAGGDSLQAVRYQEEICKLQEVVLRTRAEAMEALHFQASQMQAELVGRDKLECEKGIREATASVESQLQQALDCTNRAAAATEQSQRQYYIQEAEAHVTQQERVMEQQEAQLKQRIVEEANLHVQQQ